MHFCASDSVKQKPIITNVFGHANWMEISDMLKIDPNIIHICIPNMVLVYYPGSDFQRLEKPKGGPLEIEIFFVEWG